MERDLSIQIHSYPMGNDLAILISGGQAHIGAVAVAYPQLDRIHTETITIPGHREDQLAAEIAGIAASRLNRTVTVLMGIHVDHATKEEIDEIVHNVHDAMKQELKLVDNYIPHRV